MWSAIALTVLIAASSPTQQRVELVAKLENSVAVVTAESRELRHRRDEVVVDRGEVIGSGVVISSDGLVLTAAHVVKDAGSITIKLRDREPLPARVVVSDDSADVALLEPADPLSGLIAAPLGDSDQLRKGEPLLVIGNPLGVELSLSVGVFSGRHTVAHVFGEAGDLELLQTDAAINSGSSGGPIFNERGEVVGLAQRILSRSGGSEGLGFGISINAVKELLARDPCLWLGFSAVALPSGWAAAMNAGSDQPLLVQSVVPGSPAAAAGLRGGEIPVQSGPVHLLLGGDLITHVDGVPIASWTGRQTSEPREGAEHQLRLTVIRAGRSIELPITTKHRTLLPGGKNKS